MLLGLARKLGAVVAPETPESAPRTAGAAKFLDALAKDLSARNGRALVTAGPGLSPAAHVLALAVNERLGAAGRTVSAIAPLDSSLADGTAAVSGAAESLAALVRDMAAGKVKALLIIGGNPVFDAPADFAFGAALEKVPLR